MDDGFTVESLLRVPSIIMMALIDNPLIVSHIAKNLDITYAYTSKVVLRLTAAKIISSKRIGRSRLCSLTDKGIKISAYLSKIRLNLEEIK